MELRSQCPKFTTQWVAVGKISLWMSHNCNALFLHLAEPTQLNNRPPKWWWIVLAGVNSITHHINVSFVVLQLQNLILSQQGVELQHLAGIIQDEVGIEGPFTESQIMLYDESQYAVSKRHAVSYEHLFNFLLDQGSHIKHIFDDIMKDDEINLVKITVLETFRKFVLDLIEGASEIKLVSNGRYRVYPSRTRLHQCRSRRYPSRPTSSTNCPPWKEVCPDP